MTCSSTSSRLARLKKLERLCWQLLRNRSGAGEWGARPGGHGASIILGGGVSARHFFNSIRVSAFSS